MATKEVAIKKRAQMDKATKQMLVSVGIAAVLFGCAIVLAIYFSKWIVFNATVIGEKSSVIEDLKTVQSNMKALTNNVTALSLNENLEVVGRTRESSCANYNEEEDDNDRIEIARICSALRVIPDALPSTQNDEAVYASLNKLFLMTSDEEGNPVEPEAITPGNVYSSGLTLADGMGGIGVSLSIENTSNLTKAVLNTMERSIRNYDILTATISWKSSSNDGDSDMIELRGSAVAYYSSSVAAELKSKTIYADSEKAKTAKTTGSTK